MENLILVLVALGVIETSYLVYRSRPVNTIDDHSLLLDTSVLIDGRILPIARSGLITAPLVIPRSVVRELQYMADKADHDKRERAREGLDMIEQLQQIDELQVRLIDDPALKDGGVDERLVELAQRYGARLCTIDYNLNKAARVQGVVVVNINELAHALRIVHLPGETVELKLVQPGQESRQAVGYLDDGTMVVVDDAKGQIGQSVEVQVTRVLQTTAGKMMFAKKVSSGAQKPLQKNSGRSFSARTSQKFSAQTASNASMVAEPEAKNDSLQTASNASMIARNKSRTSKKFSSQTTNEASMVAEPEAKNDSLQTTNEGNTAVYNDAPANKSTVPRNAASSPPVSTQTSNTAGVVEAPRPATDPNKRRRTPASAPRKPSPQPTRGDGEAGSSTAQPRSKYQNQRRSRKTPEDSFLDELTKQQ